MSIWPTCGIKMDIAMVWFNEHATMSLDLSCWKDFERDVFYQENTLITLVLKYINVPKIYSLIQRDIISQNLFDILSQQQEKVPFVKFLHMQLSVSYRKYSWKSNIVEEKDTWTVTLQNVIDPF